MEDAALDWAGLALLNLLLKGSAVHEDVPVGAGAVQALGLAVPIPPVPVLAVTEEVYPQTIDVLRWRALVGENRRRCRRRGRRGWGLLDCPRLGWLRRLTNHRISAPTSNVVVGAFGAVES